MLDISGDRGVLKDIIREGAGDPVTPDASVLGMVATGLLFVLGKLWFVLFFETGSHVTPDTPSPFQMLGLWLGTTMSDVVLGTEPTSCAPCWFRVFFKVLGIVSSSR